MLTISDPRTIPQNDLPLTVLANQTNSIISSLIDWKTNSSVDHAMMYVTPGVFTSQAFPVYHNVPIEAYMKKGGRLKFVNFLHINGQAANALRNAVSARMALPWYQKMYDYLGIFGQAIGQPWIHTPGLEYCSVDVLRCWKTAAPYLPDLDRDLILSIPNESSPSVLDDYVKNHPEVFMVYGEYLSDDGVIV